MKTIKDYIIKEKLVLKKQKHINNNGYEYVDLGLPSGNLWAEANLGADSCLLPGSAYQWCNDVDITIRKNLKNRNAVEFKTPSKFDFDICQAIMKGDWEMPNAEDFQELIDNCEIVYNDSDYGISFIGPNDEVLYFPCCAVYTLINDKEFVKDEEYEDIMGTYWTRDLYDITDNDNDYVIIFNFSIDENSAEIIEATYTGHEYALQTRAIIRR
jgi:hypothetical protein